MKKNRYYHYLVCPDCKSTLDPGERCDCKDIPKVKPIRVEVPVSRLKLSETLILDVDISYNDHESALIISRFKNHKQEIVHTLYGEDAIKTYSWLTNTEIK